MARYTGPTCKLARREGTDLFLKSGAKSLEYKCKLKTPPGHQGVFRSGKISDYGLHLREKQKLRRMYGLLERQFSNYYRKAARMRGDTGECLLRLLESRLDNVVYRMGFACTRAEARQMVTHGHVRVDGERVNIPSCLVATGQTVSIGGKARGHDRVKDALTQAEGRGAAPAWLDVDAANLSGVFRQAPERAELDMEINENLIIEYYSR